MSILYDVGLYTGSTLSRDEVIRRTSATIEKLMNPDAYYIALYEVETNMVSFEVFTECGQQMPKMRMSLNKGGLTGRIIETCKPLLVQDWQIDGQQYNSVANKTGTEMLSYLGVPMVAEDKVVGVISVQSLQPLAFDAHHERLLMALSAQTGMALENARLHQLAQDQARFDSLTRVYNHGEFVNLVRQEVERSDRDDTCVALIMLDIDHFKQYNDTYGHVAGDNVLRMVANALKSSVTERDYVGRWGGEEFCVLLPGAGVQEAKKVARYIRRAIAELYPVDGHGHLIPNPMVSQGISSYPYPSASSSDLIEEADSALYQAKKRGRNQLIVYEGRGILKEATTTTGHLSAKMLIKDAQDKEKTATTGNLAPALLNSISDKEAVITTPRLA
jgi:diguanylate cyclase (GGDEF)-like protein